MVKNSAFGSNRKIKILFFFLLLILVVGIFFFSGQFLMNNFFVKTQLSLQKEVKKGDVLKLKFSAPMNKSSVESGFSITPQIKTQTWWQDERTFCLRIEEALYPNKEYVISVQKAKTFWLFGQKDIRMIFKSLSAPELIYVDPADTQTNVGIKSDFILKFNMPLGEIYQTQVKVTPFPQEGFDYQWQQNKRVITLIPRNRLEYNTQYNLKVELVSPLFDNFYQELYAGNFITGRPPLVTYSFDKNGNAVKTEEQKEIILPAFDDVKYIDIDISSQQLTLFDFGQVIGSYKISSGKRGMETPIGNFFVIAKASRPWSDKYKLFMPWFIQFTNQGHGLHELPEWPGGYKEGQNHLGVPVSHGCVRLGVGPAKLVYDFAQAGMPIVIHE